MIEVCPGHVLDRRILDWARSKFRQLDDGDFLETAGKISRMSVLPNDPYAVFDADSPESRTYAEMVDIGDWPGADKTYLDWIKARDPELYLETLKMEALAREFNTALAAKFAESSHIDRWMDEVELSSYLHGTFESKVESDGSHREHKAFSLGTNIHSDERPASLTVPVNNTIRGALRTAVYTALSRLIRPEDERLGDKKHISYAHETECRLPTGIEVPRNARITITRSMLDPEYDHRHLHRVIAQLRGMMEVDFI